jgi:hypothetical protein
VNNAAQFELLGDFADSDASATRILY